MIRIGIEKPLQGAMTFAQMIMSLTVYLARMPGGPTVNCYVAV